MFVHKKLITLFESNGRAFEFFKWSGNIFNYVAAIAISVSIVAAQSIWPFVLYILGNIVWFTAALIMKDRPLFWNQAFFVVINVYAIWLRA